MPKQYNPFDWYWRRDDDGVTVSSARQTVVSSKDAGLAAWCSDGSPPWPWPIGSSGKQDAAALQEVWTPYGLTVPKGVS